MYTCTYVHWQYRYGRYGTYSGSGWGKNKRSGPVSEKRRAINGKTRHSLRWGAAQGMYSILMGGWNQKRRELYICTRVYIYGIWSILYLSTLRMWIGLPNRARHWGRAGRLEYTPLSTYIPTYPPPPLECTSIHIQTTVGTSCVYSTVQYSTYDIYIRNACHRQGPFQAKASKKSIKPLW